ncbi:MAG: transposase [Candidatus Dadabacteria bacterium]|nr:transposase [Candidatus Dadabacteria bacterium]MCH8014633.1 transposase [Candidatus Dadabacteria bacterium]
MARKRYTPEQIIRHLKQAEVLFSQGRSVSEICREIGGNREHLLPLAEGIRRYAGQSGKTVKRA